MSIVTWIGDFVSRCVTEMMATFRGSFCSHVPEIWMMATFGGFWCSHVSQIQLILYYGGRAIDTHIHEGG